MINSHTLDYNNIFFRQPFKYQQINAMLKGKINSGEYKEGDKLPSCRQIAKEYNINLTTANKVLSSLVTEGYAYAIHGKGMFVKVSHERSQVSRYPIAYLHALQDESNLYHHPHYSGLIQSLLTLANEADYNLQIFHRQRYSVLDNKNSQLKQAIIEKQLSGYVLQTPHPEYFWAEAQMIGIPFVFLGSRIDKSDVANLVTFDWEYTGYCGTKHLLECGYDRIGFLHSVEILPEFILGCRKAYLEIKGKGDAFPVSSHVSDIIGKVDAVIILDDVFAHQVIKEIIALRIDIPRDLALAVVMNKGMIFDFPLKMSALEIDPFDVIQAAWNILFSQIRGEKKYHEQILVKPRLITGETT